MATNEPNGTPTRIMLWATPRSLSTAFEKCVGFIDGVQIWHEPYATSFITMLLTNPDYLAKFPKMKYMMRQFGDVFKLLEDGGHIFQGGNLIQGANFTAEWVKEQLSKPLQEGKNIMFIKDVPWAVNNNYDILPEVPLKHTFIIRHPHRIVLSGRRSMMNLFEYEGEPDDFDFAEGNPFVAWEKGPKNPLYQMYNYVCENIEPNPIVIDADDLQNHPEEMMTKYCKAVGIPFEKKHIQWDKSDESLKYFYGSLEQMVWGKSNHIYDAAFLSSSFLPCNCKIPETVPALCQNTVDDLLAGYKEMYKNRMKPNN